MDQQVPVSFLRDSLEHRDDGTLVWRERPRSHFSSDAYRVSRNKRFTGEPITTRNAGGYLVVSVTWQGKKRKLLVARVAWALRHGVWPTHTIDHINRIRDDNRIENLRDVSMAVNAANRGPWGAYAARRNTAVPHAQGASA